MTNANPVARQPASLARRSIAATVDGALLVALTVSLLLLFYGQQYFDPEYWRLLPGYRGFLAWAVIVPSSAILLCWIVWQRTPGKALCSLLIVDQSSGASPSALQFARRLAGFYLCIASLGLGFALAAFSAQRQGLADKLAETLVVSLASPEPATTTPGDSSRWLPWFTAIISAAIALAVFYSPIGTGNGGGVIGYSIYRGLLLLFVHIPLILTGIVIAVAIGLEHGRKCAAPGIAANIAALAGVLLCGYLAG